MSSSSALRALLCHGFYIDSQMQIWTVAWDIAANSASIRIGKYRIADNLDEAADSTY